MAMQKGCISIDTENIFPIIKKWLYSDKDIFIRELISNGCDAISKYKRAAAKDKNIDKAVIDVIEEIADVNIMIKQVMMLLDIEEFEVQNIEIAKLNRLEKRMDS